MATSLPSTRQNAFEKALGAFKSRLKPSESAQFGTTTLDELKSTILSIQAEQRAKKQMRNMDRVRSFLEAMEQFGKVIEVFLNVSELLAFVWGPMKLLLLTASTWADSLDALLDAYESIASNMPLFENYESIYSGNPAMQTVLQCVWSNIFEFHIRALRIFERSLLQNFFRSLWKDFNARFQHILSDFKRLKDLVRDYADQFHIQQYAADRLRLLHEVEASQESRRLERKLFVTKWIEAPKISSDHEHHQSIRQAQYKATNRPTAQWIFQHDDIIPWLSPRVPKSSILWINAIAGAGKSVLASAIIDEIIQKDLASVAYIYCKHKDPTKNEFLSIVKAFLAQLLNQHDYLVPFYYDFAVKSGEVSMTSVSSAKKLISSLLQAVPKSYLIIDGLDECEAAQRKLTLEFFNEQVDICDQTDPAKVRLLFLSRNEPDIKKYLGMSTAIRVNDDDTAEDLRVYIEHQAGELQSNFGLTPEDKSYIEKNVNDRCDGMFLYAKLVMTHLEDQPTKKDLIEQYHKLPEGLEEAYSRNLDRIQKNRNETKRKLAHKLLSLMVSSRRPLRWRELQAVMSIDMDEQTIDLTRRLETSVDNLCGSLVEILPGDRVEFVHITAFWYILKLEFITAALAERTMATICLNYLTFDCFEAECSNEQLVVFWKTGQFGFQDYAIAHWTDHVVASMKPSHEDGAPRTIGKEDAVSKSLAVFEQRFDADLDLQSIESESGTQSLDGTTRILNHATAFKTRTDDSRDKVSLKSLGIVLQESRKAMEGFRKSVKHSPEENILMTNLYGENWFKCDRLSCHYFHEGFPNHSERQAHHERHERPFKCDEEDCPASGIGLSSLKELEKHKRNIHPGFDKLSTMFARLKGGKTGGVQLLKHPCPRCSERFATRLDCRIHLKCHNRVLRPKDSPW